MDKLPEDFTSTKDTYYAALIKEFEPCDPIKFPRYIETPGNCGIMSVIIGINPSARQLLMNSGWVWRAGGGRRGDGREKYPKNCGREAQAAPKRKEGDKGVGGPGRGLQHTVHRKPNGDGGSTLWS